VWLYVWRVGWKAVVSDNYRGRRDVRSVMRVVGRACGG
jgi:hypothetical protein